MSDTNGQSPRAVLQAIARRAMVARGLEPDFPPAALAEVSAFERPARATDSSVKDLRELLWCSIDNDESRDLDQLSVAELMPSGRTKLLVAIADVASLVKRGTALDEHARKNTTSVYTIPEIFPMLPERLSTDLTSLNFGEDRLAIVVEMEVAEEGSITRSEIYEATVRNRARLSYTRVAAWLSGAETPPSAVAAVPGLDANIRLQLRAAAQLKALRHTRGALDFETVETRPIFVDGKLQELAATDRNPAKDLIQDLMIAANGVTATFLEAKNLPSIRRVVRTPKQWGRIVELAQLRGTTLPAEPNPVELEKFLVAQKAQDPSRFADLSLSVIKLLGAGAYAVELPGDHSQGHFGLAVKDYAHSTAPNRRFPDLLTQRLLKAAIASLPTPYSPAELRDIAAHCTAQEDAAKKVERQVIKSAASLLLEERLGDTFDALVTGASAKGTWVRISRPLVEGKVVRGFQGLQVGDRVRVRLLQVNSEKGLIDFAAV